VWEQWGSQARLAFEFAHALDWNDQSLFALQNGQEEDDTFFTDAGQENRFYT